MTLTRSILAGLGLFVALFLLRLGTHAPPTGADWGFANQQQAFEIGRKNYASTASAKGAAAPAAAAAPLGDVQRYEKIATLGQVSPKFDDDRKTLTAAIATYSGVVQLERFSGLKGRRTLALGIGVPPEKFDPFIESAQLVGRNVQVEIVKNDKTNDYLQMQAKRITLDKTRTALQALATSGGSVDERLKVQGQLTDLEDKIQALGVSLGEFDARNELCTVKVTLTEYTPPTPVSLARRAISALEWTAGTYALSAIGIAIMVGCLWAAAALGRMLLKQYRADRDL